LKSEALEDGDNVSSEYTCDGRNISLQLSWEDSPNETKSFALNVTDPNAPRGRFIHWLIYDIPKGTRSIEKRRFPVDAKQVLNDFDKKDYGGPCPTYGTHRYVYSTSRP